MSAPVVAGRGETPPGAGRAAGDAEPEALGVVEVDLACFVSIGAARRWGHGGRSLGSEGQLSLAPNRASTDPSEGRKRTADRPFLSDAGDTGDPALRPAGDANAFGVISLTKDAKVLGQAVHADAELRGFDGHADNSRSLVVDSDRSREARRMHPEPRTAGRDIDGGRVFHGVAGGLDGGTCVAVYLQSGSARMDPFERRRHDGSATIGVGRRQGWGVDVSAVEGAGGGGGG